VSHLERVRDYVEGHLPPEERDAFRREVEADPALAGLVETYQLVVRATAEPAPASTTTYVDVMDQIRGASRWRWRPWLAAAAALLLALGAWLLVRGAPAREPVVLGAIALDALSVPAEPPAWPRELVTHATADEQGLVWYTDLERALAVARAAGRPVFLYVDMPGCPWCRDFRAEQCCDERVIRAAGAFVLLNLPWQRTPEDLREDPDDEDGWPVYHVLDQDGKRLTGYSGLRPAEDVARWLQGAHARLVEERAFSFPDWEPLRDGARKLAEAGREEDPARRLGLLRQVSQAHPDDMLGEAARAGLLRMEKEAQDALFAARALAPAAAAERLAAAAAALRGTPYAADLERVLAHVREHGAFPDLRAKS